MSRSPKKNKKVERKGRTVEEMHLNQEGRKTAAPSPFLFKIMPSGNWKLSHHHME